MNHIPSLADVRRISTTRSLGLRLPLSTSPAGKKICTWLVLVVAGLLRICGGTDSGLAETAFFDTFADGDSRDGMPVTWDGASTVDDGDLVLSSTNFNNLIARGISLGDVSIRTQLRLLEGRVVGVDGRGGPPVGGISNYYGFMNPSRQLVGVGFAGPGGITTTATASIDFDARQEDAMLQFDMIGDTYSLWVWPAGESMPAEPLVSATGASSREGGVSVWADNPSGGPATALFRYVHVADTHLTDSSSRLLAGDADQDLDFDDMDLVRVQEAGKYLTGQPATWSEGDWNGAPSGTPENPPLGDGIFNQLDIVAAQQAGVYATGWYDASHQNGQRPDAPTSLHYDPRTGELSVDAPAGMELTSVNIDSATGIFTGAAAQNLSGIFDNDANDNIFKATFGSSFGSLSFGNVAQAGLSEQFVLGDLSVIGSIAGGGGLGNIDLVYVGESIPGDYNGNGLVEQGDLDLVLLNWGTDVSTLPTDWVSQRPTDGIVDQAALDGVLLNWGNGGPRAASGVPEPGTLLLALVTLALIWGAPRPWRQ